MDDDRDDLDKNWIKLGDAAQSVIRKAQVRALERALATADRVLAQSDEELAQGKAFLEARREWLDRHGG